ncbi:GNAT family N-acetyltransferase [Paenibacillus sp. HJGM_3]|uniref:GNAT family N-acetyltransferase n=1 Tax=Paenibacillus sp. HJGM_3 TaxID=3379816 RepID=UPI0038587744
MREAEWRLSPLTESQGRLLTLWRYPAPYDVYNWPTWAKMLETGYEFADPRIREQQYLAAHLDTGQLAGFAQLFPMQGWTRLGLGMHPDLCGQGLGRSFVQAILCTAQQKAPSKQIDLEVLVWNVRAIRTYEAAGFVITDTYDRRSPDGTNGRYHCMVAAESSRVSTDERPERAEWH